MHSKRMLYSSLLSDRLYLAGGRAERGESDTSNVKCRLNSPTFVQRIFGLHLHKTQNPPERPATAIAELLAAHPKPARPLRERSTDVAVARVLLLGILLRSLQTPKHRKKNKIMPASTAAATTAGSSSNAAVPSSGGGGGGSGRGGRGRYGSRGGGGGGGGGVSFGKLVENVSRNESNDG
jgi:uncharacterized membrane protein YgcG